MPTRANTHKHSLFIVILAMLVACSEADLTAGASVVDTTTESVDGSGTSAIAAPQTSKTYTAETGSAWTAFTVNLGADFLSSNICTGKSIFGRAGAATCTSIAGTIFGDLIASGAHRDVGSAQQTISDESADGLATGYRAIPDITKDDDGYHQETDGGSQLNGAACTAAGGANQTCSTAIWQQANRPSVNCGITGSIEARITDCATENPAANTWTAESSGLAGESDWSLVTRIEDTAGRSYEVWRDNRTKLLWSDRLGDLTADDNKGEFNWCLASGNTQSAALGGVECQDSTASSYNNVSVSLCHDDGAGALDTPDGVNDVTTANGLTYWGFSVTDGRTETEQNSVVRAKGNLTSLAWRLPTRSDYMQAVVNGIQYVVPNALVSSSVSSFQWTSTVVSNARAQAWAVHLGLGRFVEAARTQAYAVRCVANGT